MKEDILYFQCVKKTSNNISLIVSHFQRLKGRQKVSPSLAHHGKDINNGFGLPCSKSSFLFFFLINKSISNSFLCFFR